MTHTAVLSTLSMQGKRPIRANLVLFHLRCILIPIFRLKKVVCAHYCGIQGNQQCIERSISAQIRAKTCTSIYLIYNDHDHIENVNNCLKEYLKCESLSQVTWISKCAISIRSIQIISSITRTTVYCIINKIPCRECECQLSKVFLRKKKCKMRFPSFCISG